MGSCLSSGETSSVENPAEEVLSAEQIALAEKKAHRKQISAFHNEQENEKAASAKGTRDTEIVEDKVEDEESEMHEIFPTPGFIVKVLRKGKIKVFLNVCFSNQVRQMFVNVPRLTKDKNGNDSVAYDCVLTDAMYNQTFNSGSDHVMHTLCVTVIKKVNENYDDALALEYTRVKKAKKFIGEAEFLCASVPHSVFFVPGGTNETTEHIAPMTRSGILKKHGHTNSDAKDRFFFLCSGYLFYYEQEKPIGFNSNPPYGTNLKSYLCLACYDVTKGDNNRFTITQNDKALKDQKGLPETYEKQHKSYELIAKNESDRESWVTCIQRHVSYAEFLRHGSVVQHVTGSEKNGPILTLDAARYAAFIKPDEILLYHGLVAKKKSLHTDMRYMLLIVKYGSSPRLLYVDESSQEIKGEFLWTKNSSVTCEKKSIDNFEIKGAAVEDSEGRDAEELFAAGMTKIKTLHFAVKGGAQEWTDNVTKASLFFV